MARRWVGNAYIELEIQNETEAELQRIVKQLETQLAQNPLHAEVSAILDESSMKRVLAKIDSRLAQEFEADIVPNYSMTKGQIVEGKLALLARTREALIVPVLGGIGNILENTLGLSGASNGFAEITAGLSGLSIAVELWTRLSHIMANLPQYAVNLLSIGARFTLIASAATMAASSVATFATQVLPTLAVLPSFITGISLAILGWQRAWNELRYSEYAAGQSMYASVVKVRGAIDTLVESYLRVGFFTTQFKDWNNELLPFYQIFSQIATQVFPVFNRHARDLGSYMGGALTGIINYWTRAANEGNRLDTMLGTLSMGLEKLIGGIGNFGIGLSSAMENGAGAAKILFGALGELFTAMGNGLGRLNFAEVERQVQAFVNTLQGGFYLARDFILFMRDNWLAALGVPPSATRGWETIAAFIDHISTSAREGTGIIGGLRVVVENLIKGGAGLVSVFEVLGQTAIPRVITLLQEATGTFLPAVLDVLKRIGTAIGETFSEDFIRGFVKAARDLVVTVPWERLVTLFHMFAVQIKAMYPEMARIVKAGAEFGINLVTAFQGILRVVAPLKLALVDFLALPVAAYLAAFLAGAKALLHIVTPLTSAIGAFVTVIKGIQVLGAKKALVTLLTGGMKGLKKSVDPLQGTLFQLNITLTKLNATLTKVPASMRLASGETLKAATSNKTFIATTQGVTVAVDAQSTSLAGRIKIEAALAAEQKKNIATSTKVSAIETKIAGLRQKNALATAQVANAEKLVNVQRGVSKKSSTLLSKATQELNAAVAKQVSLNNKLAVQQYKITAGTKGAAAAQVKAAAIKKQLTAANAAVVASETKVAAAKTASQAVSTKLAVNEKALTAARKAAAATNKVTTVQIAALTKAQTALNAVQKAGVVTTTALGKSKAVLALKAAALGVAKAFVAVKAAILALPLIAKVAIFAAIAGAIYILLERFGLLSKIMEVAGKVGNWVGEQFGRLRGWFDDLTGHTARLAEEVRLAEESLKSFGEGADISIEQVSAAIERLSDPTQGIIDSILEAGVAYRYTFDEMGNIVREYYDAYSQEILHITQLQGEYADKMAELVKQRREEVNQLTELIQIEVDAHNQRVAEISKSISTLDKRFEQGTAFIEGQMVAATSAVAKNSRSQLVYMEDYRGQIIGKTEQAWREAFRYQENYMGVARSSAETILGDIESYVVTYCTRSYAELKRNGQNAKLVTRDQYQSMADTAKQYLGVLEREATAHYINETTKIQVHANGMVETLQRQADGMYLATKNGYLGMDEIQVFTQQLMNAQSSEHAAKMVEITKQQLADEIQIYEKSVEDFISAGENTLQGYMDGIISKEQALMELAEQVCTNTLNAFKVALGIRSPSEKTFYYGEMTAQGFADGINARMRNVTDAVNRLADEAARAMRLRAQISSPSRVFMALGEYLGEGLEVGMLKCVPRIQKASETLADAAAESLEALDFESFLDKVNLSSIGDLTGGQLNFEFNKGSLIPGNNSNLPSKPKSRENYEYSTDYYSSSRESNGYSREDIDYLLAGMAAIMGDTRTVTAAGMEALKYSKLEGMSNLSSNPYYQR